MFVFRRPANCPFWLNWHVYTNVYQMFTVSVCFALINKDVGWHKLYQPESKTVAAIPDYLQHIASILHLISNGGVVPTGHVDRCDIGRCVGGVGVWVPIEGVVPERWAVRRKASRHLHLDGVARDDHCVTDDCLGIRTAGRGTAGLVGHFAL